MKKILFAIAVLMCVQVHAQIQFKDKPVEHSKEDSVWAVATYQSSTNPQLWPVVRVNLGYMLRKRDTASMLANYRHWLMGYLTRTAGDAIYQPIGSYAAGTHTHGSGDIFGTKTAAYISNFQTTVSANGDVAAATSHIANTTNPHNVTKAQVGLGNVDNTADASKPVSTAQQTALDLKANTTHAHSASDITAGQLAAARLAAGTATNGYVVKSVSGVPTWSADATGVGGGGTLDVAPTDGSINGVESNGVFDALALKAGLTAFVDGAVADSVLKFYRANGDSAQFSVSFPLDATLIDGSVKAPTGNAVFDAVKLNTDSITAHNTRILANTNSINTNTAAIATNTSGISTINSNYKKEVFIVAISDETTALTTGTAKVTFRMPYACTLTAVRASLTTASSSGLPTFNIKESGATVLSTNLSIDASEKTSTTAATAAVISDSAMADDAEITIDITVSGTGATGAKIYFYVTKI